MKNGKFEWRMYFFVPYNISPIQQAIQAGHSALEYARKYGEEEDFKQFVFWDKTWIILNGGTTNDTHMGNAAGSMQELYEDIRSHGIPLAIFYEPDLNSAMTAICFLADERVWDHETYPDFVDFIFSLPLTSEEKLYLNLLNITQLKRTPLEDVKKILPEYYSKWESNMGGSKNIYLRELLRHKKLA